MAVEFSKSVLINRQIDAANSIRAQMFKTKSQNVGAGDSTTTAATGSNNNATNAAGISTGVRQNSVLSNKVNRQEFTLQTVSLGASGTTDIKGGEGVSTQATVGLSLNADTAKATTGVNANSQQAIRAYKGLTGATAANATLANDKKDFTETNQKAADYQKSVDQILEFRKANLINFDTDQANTDSTQNLQQVKVSALAQGNQAQQQLLSLFRG